MDPVDLLPALDQVADLLLASAGLTQPPIDQRELAGRLGISVAIDTRQNVRARQKRIDGRVSVFLRPEPREERCQWAVAHEIAEQAAYRVFQFAGMAADEVSPRWREQIANQLASRLLMPPAAFAADAARWGYDLIELKRRYATASHESIAWRLLSLSAALIVTVFDQGRQTSRRSNLPGRLPRLGPREQDCWEAVHRENKPRRIEGGSVGIFGFPIHEEHWKREILLTRLEPEFAEVGQWAI